MLRRFKPTYPRTIHASLPIVLSGALLASQTLCTWIPPSYDMARWHGPQKERTCCCLLDTSCCTTSLRSTIYYNPKEPQLQKHAEDRTQIKEEHPLVGAYYWHLRFDGFSKVKITITTVLQLSCRSDIKLLNERASTRWAAPEEGPWELRQGIWGYISEMQRHNKRVLVST